MISPPQTHHTTVKSVYYDSSCNNNRNAIEEELEVLYDAYYEELEQYANHQQRYVNSGGTIPPPPGPGPFPGSVELDKNGAVVSPIPTGANGKRRGGKHRQQPPSINGRKALPTAHHDPLHHHHHHHHHHDGSGFEDEDGEDYGEEDEYEDEDEDEEEEEEEEEEEDDDLDDDRGVLNGRGKTARQTPAGRRSVVGKARRGMNGVKRDGFNLTSLAVSGEFIFFSVMSFGKTS